MRLILFIVIALGIWFAYTNWGTSLNIDSTVQQGTSSIKTEKSINRVIQGRENTLKDNQEILDKM